MRKGSMLAGLRPRDDESETELEDESALDEDEAPESEPAPKTRAARPSRKGMPKPSPEATRALDLQIFSAADLLEMSLGRAPTHAEIAAKAKVPGPTDGARKQRVSMAMRRRALLTEPAKKPSRGARPNKVQAAPITPERAPAAAPSQVRAYPEQTTLGVRAVEALRDRLRHQLEAVEVTVAALRGES